ncbi:hypothetical protein EPIB1_695 [Tritonibacter mobilis]|nr:hypothetical protein SCH4B_1398 [Ruegeria sp. TrichCH4B]VCU57797.1 hypothetical protein EPIB1_695 [Tritonibacter mobilis]
MGNGHGRASRSRGDLGPPFGVPWAIARATSSVTLLRPTGLRAFN